MQTCKASLGAIRCILPSSHESYRHPLTSPELIAHRARNGWAFVTLKPLAELMEFPRERR